MPATFKRAYSFVTTWLHQELVCWSQGALCMPSVPCGHEPAVALPISTVQRSSPGIPLLLLYLTTALCPEQDHPPVEEAEDRNPQLPPLPPDPPSPIPKPPTEPPPPSAADPNGPVASHYQAQPWTAAPLPASESEIMPLEAPPLPAAAAPAHQAPSHARPASAGGLATRLEPKLNRIKHVCFAGHTGSCIWNIAEHSISPDSDTWHEATFWLSRLGNP